MTQLISLKPNFMVTDVRASVRFYCDVLGFNFVMWVGQEDALAAQDDTDSTLRFAVVESGGHEIFLQSRESLAQDIPAFNDQTPIGASMTLYLECPDLDAMYQKIKNDVTIIKEPSQTWYGMKEFYIRDQDGYILAFGQKA